MSLGNRIFDEIFNAYDQEEAVNQLEIYRNEQTFLKEHIQELQTRNRNLETKLTERRSEGTKIAFTQASIQLSASAVLYLTIAAIASTMPLSAGEVVVGLFEHTYLAAWIAGLNLLALSIVSALRRHG